MQDLAGRTAVVTGGGQGIGRAIALALAEAGMRVAVLDIEADAAERTAGELEARGTRSFARRVDVTDERSLADAAAAVSRALGPVHVLSNNAGVSAPQGPIAGKTDADWQWVFSVNLFGIVKAVQAFLPGMRAHGEGGHIVNTSSMAGLIAVPELQVGVYTASKYACTAYCEILRAKLATEGIGVSVLCPGFVNTNIYDSGRNRQAEYGESDITPTPEGEQRRAMLNAMREQMMQPAEIGELVFEAVRTRNLYIVPTGSEALENAIRTRLENIVNRRNPEIQLSIV